MKLTFLLPIIMSLAVFSNIASAEDRGHNKHHKRPNAHEHTKSKTDRIKRKNIIYENGAVLPQNSAVRNKHRANKNSTSNKRNKDLRRQDVYKSNLNKNRKVLPKHRVAKHKQKVRQAIVSRNLKDKRDKRFRKRAIYRTGARIHKSPRNGRTLRFGGLSFIFSSGLYYQHLNNAYTVVRPPIGLKIRYLPNGFEDLFINGNHYYFYQGIYYIATGAYYQVVEEPFNDTVSSSINQANKEQQNEEFELGQRYSTLPEGSQLVVINGDQYFKYQDIYFLPQSSDSSVDYLAVKLD